MPEGDKKGFAGIASMASDVDNLVEKTHEAAVKKENLEKTKNVDNAGGEKNKTSQGPYVYQPVQGSSTKAAPSKAQQNNQQKVYHPQPSSSGGIGKFIVIGLIVLCGVGYFATSGTKKATPVKPTTSTTQKANSSEITYDKPPQGSGRVLTMPQLHWVHRESIRLDTLKSLAKTEKGIDEYNKMANDFNSRAGSYKARNKDDSRAKSDVEAQKSKIIAEAQREAKSKGWY